MPRRRCSRKKGKYICDKCDRFYSSSQSLYYHCYQKHRGINNNNIEIDGDNIHNNILIEEEYNDDNLEEISDDDLEAISALPVNVKLQELYKFDDYKVNVNQSEISNVQVKENSDNQVKEIHVNEEVKENSVNKVKENPVNKVKENPVNKIKENSVNEVKLEEQNSILKDTLDLINKCISNNIDINLKIKINNKTIEIKSD